MIPEQIWLVDFRTGWRIAAAYRLEETNRWNVTEYQTPAEAKHEDLDKPALLIVRAHFPNETKQTLYDYEQTAELCEAIRIRQPNIPIVILQSNPISNDKRKLFPPDAKTFNTRFSTTEDLRRLVEDLLPPSSLNREAPLSLAV